MIAAVDSTQPVRPSTPFWRFSWLCATSSCLQLVDRAWLRLRVEAAGNRETSSVHGLRSARCPHDRPGWEPLGGDAVSERERNAHESVESAVPRRSARCAVGFASRVAHFAQTFATCDTVAARVADLSSAPAAHRGQERDAGRLMHRPRRAPDGVVGARVSVALWTA